MTEKTCDFECAIRANEVCPDDIALWPEDCRRAAFAARDRLLQAYPERRVIEEVSYCLDRTHHRFPDAPPHINHMLVFQIKLDGPVDPTIRWNDKKSAWERAA